ncbi:hypothetical protein D6850_00115 [Roseovarius spongiae]|uniref:VPLPA-CTERM sorting domain-containing protein n=1 Tax=Roseovarius spongiae TaxID=2320272 RepID=A0A3A8AUW7_9RHOB|nr:hypothetical protein [Roseovarius spongiae]RKF16018.1 hypothetical protein D6850_00115 [Roseovarius spongiae]
MISRVIAAALVAGLAATGAGAATLDFVAEAFGDERGVADGTTINNVNTGFLNVTFSSSHFAYFDDLSGGKPAGLGVCKVLTGDAQCKPSSDDNVTSGESVTLTFDTMVDLLGLSFFNADHNPVSATDTLRIGTDLMAIGETTFGAASAATFSGITSITFAYGGSSANQFYVAGATATPVPIPASLPLLVGGLGLMGWVARRRRKA